MLLAGDIGGTKTDLAIFSVERGPHSPIAQTQVHSADYPSLQVLVKEFLEKAKTPVERACFDVAGPVIDGRVKITNLPWVIDEASLAKDLNFKFVHLMNDLEAVARAVPILRAIDVITLNVGQPVPKGAIAVVAPGTGLGESFLTWDGSKYVSHSSEGGHADFAPTNERQIGLLKFMLRRFDHVSVERVCSGIGIPSIYEYLRDVEQIPEKPEIAQAIASATDHTAAITNSAFDEYNPCELCKATVDTFVSILASEAANMALKVMATGGVYLAGGIPLHMAHPAEKSRFMETFKRKGRFSQLMAHLPVHVILNRAALLGSAAYGLESFKEE
ncbi:MAG TPA: glucokinase [Pyrinomonadaceae bacterium]|jgi:glucokinase|nr:glucokinase [Pyrinomonadaceae bacterium]